MVLASSLTMAPLSFYHIQMIRSVVALLIAPLWVPLMVASHDLLLTFQHPDIHYLTVFPWIVFAVIGYGSTLLLGVPVLVFARWLGFSGWLVSGVIGFFIGAALWLGCRCLVSHCSRRRHSTSPTSGCGPGSIELVMAFRCDGCRRWRDLLADCAT